jgi:succinylglutamate desuccinylase
MNDKRIIGRFTGEEKGPLIICFGGMHGNEPAGVKALDLMFKMLEVEPITNPDFYFRGRLLGLRGNVQALDLGVRYLEKDLNRMWRPEVVEPIMAADRDQLQYEDLELRENLEIIHKELKEYEPDEVLVLDIHTTTAFGGIFSIATDDPDSIKIAIEIHAPVITGMLEGIHGTGLHYFNKAFFDYNMVPVVFEAGQHYEPLSVNRAIAAVTNCMRTLGCVRAEDVENQHDQLLLEYADGLPKVAELITVHRITPEDQFKMLPGFNNFQEVRKGQQLALDKEGVIIAPEDGLILMPLYQSQGDDGFFLIRQIEY